MLKQHANAVHRILIAGDAGITAFSFILAFRLARAISTKLELTINPRVEGSLWLLAVIIPGWVILLDIYDAYRSYRTASIIDELIAIGKTVLTGGLLTGFLLFITGSNDPGRMWLFAFLGINMILLTAERGLVRGLSHLVRERGYNYRNVVIVGINGTATDIAARIETQRSWGLRVLGFVSLASSANQFERISSRVLGSLDELEAIIRQEPVDEVIFAVPGEKIERIADALLMLEDYGIKARIVTSIFPHAISKLRIEEMGSVPMLTFTTGPEHSVAVICKRLFDIVFSLILLVLAVPIAILTAILIKSSSPGPVLFRQPRSGLNGRVFTMYKFRSMFVGSETRRAELQQYNEMDGPAFKMIDDPRISPLGKILRKYSIDEIPQFWNVLIGDMSIVGPRPPLPEEVSFYSRWHRRRLSMRPGLTCLWQIGGRNRLSNFDEWARLDLQYIDSWSLTLDCKILLKTIPVVMFGRGAR